MSNTFKGIIISAVAIVTCVVLTIAFYVTNAGSDDLNSNLEQVNKIAKQYAGGELQIYNDKVVTGDEVIYAVKTFGLTDSSDKISENPLKVKIDIVSSKGTFKADKSTLSTLKDKNSGYYVDETSQYNATLTIKDNQVVKIVFALIENYVSNESELNGYEDAMATTANPNGTVSTVVPAVGETAEWGGDGSTSEDDSEGIDKITDTDVNSTEWEYTISDGIVTITKYKGSKINVSVPTELEGKPVKYMSSGVFKGNIKLQKVVIPSEILSIGNDMFNGCTSLSTVTLSDSITSIPAGLFYNCKSLTGVDIPDGVTSIGKSAFYNCASITSLDIPDVLTDLGSGAFYNCTGLQLLHLPSGITEIKSSTFFNCSSLQSVNTEGTNYVQIVGDAAFFGCSSLRQFGFANVTKIGDEAFSECTSLAGIVAGKLTTLGMSAFSGCTSLAEVNLSDSTKLLLIDDAVFMDCINLSKLALPSTIASIGIDSFRNCTSLTSFEVTANLSEISSYAFYGCSGLTTLTFNETLKTLGTSSFGECSSLGDCYFYASAESARPYMGNKVFSEPSDTLVMYVYYNSTAHKHAVKNNIKYVLLDATDWVYDVTDKGIILTGYLGSDTDVTVPSSIQGKAVIGFGRSDGEAVSVFADKPVTSVTFTSGPTYIGDSAFSNVSTLQSVTLCSDITNIGNNAFSGCSNLVTVNYTDNIKIIGDYAFEKCTSLTSYETNGKETSFGVGAFKDCSTLSKFELPTTYTKLPNELFYGCSSLTDINMNNITEIGNGTFAYCGFTSIELPISVKTIGSEAFRGNNNLESITLPSQLQSIGESALAECKLTSLSIPLTLKDIPASFAANNESLVNLTIPDTVQTIGDGAFNGCTSLGDVYWYGKSIPNFGTNSFVACNSLMFYVYNRSNAYYYAIDNNIKYTLLDKVSDDWIYYTDDDDNIILEQYIGEDCTLLYVPDNIDGKPTIALGEGLVVFAGKSIEAISVPSTIESIGDYAFSGLDMLTSVNFNADSYTLGKYAFSKCSTLTNVNISGATALSEGLFSECTSLETVTYSDFSTIPAYCFYKCEKFTTDKLTNVISVGSYAFYDSLDGANITFTDSLKLVNDNAFGSSLGFTHNIDYASVANTVIFTNSAFDGSNINVKLYPYSYAETIFNKDHTSFKFSGATSINIEYYPISSIVVTTQPYVTEYFVGKEFVSDGMEVSCTFDTITEKTVVWTTIDNYGWTYDVPETTLGTRKVTVRLNTPNSGGELTTETTDIVWKERSDYERFGFEFTKQPSDLTLNIDKQTGTYDVELKIADGCTVNLQWYYRVDEGSWITCTESGYNTTTLNVGETHGTVLQDGMEFKCVASTDEAMIESDIVKLTVEWTSPLVKTHPSNQAVKSGNKATFSCEATVGFATATTYQWQQSTDSGSTWTNVSGATSASYTTGSTTSGMNGYKYRCAISNRKYTVYTNAATLTVYYTFAVKAPTAQTVIAGQTFTFSTSITTAGNPNSYTYQWQYSTDGSTWSNISGATSASYSATAYKSYSGRKYRCVVKSSQYTVISSGVSLTVNNDISIASADNGSLASGSATTALCLSTVTITASSLDYVTGTGLTWKVVSGSGTLSATSGASVTLTGTSTTTSSVTVTCKTPYEESHSITITFNALTGSVSTVYTSSGTPSVCMGDTLTITSNAKSAKVNVIDWASATEISAAAAGNTVTKTQAAAKSYTGSSVNHTVQTLSQNVTLTASKVYSNGYITIYVRNPYDTSKYLTFKYLVRKTQWRHCLHPTSYSDWTAGELRYLNRSHSVTGYGGKADTNYLNYVSSSNRYWYYLYSAASITGGATGSMTHIDTKTSTKSGYSGTVSRHRMTSSGTGTCVLYFTDLGNKAITITINK